MIITESKNRAKISNSSASKSKPNSAIAFNKFTESMAANKGAAVNTPPTISAHLGWEIISEEQKAYAHGDDLLGSLKELHKKLILGDDLESTLNKLRNASLQEFSSLTDHKLLAVIKEIRVRAAVELAKQRI